MYQSPIAVADILGDDNPPADYRALPRVTFTDPEIGAVGLTEAQARQAGVAMRTGTASLPSTARGGIHKLGNDGLTKLVEDTERGVLVGPPPWGPLAAKSSGCSSSLSTPRSPSNNSAT